MSSDKRNLTTVKVTGLIFSLFTSLQLDTCLLAYHSMHNAFFVNLPVSPFMCHSSLQSVDLTVARDGCNGNRLYF